MSVKETIFESIKEAKRILIIPSAPADGDSLCSALALEQWLLNEKREVEIASWINYQTVFTDSFPPANRVRYTDPVSIDFKRYDCIVILDGTAWSKIFGPNYEKVLEKIDLEKVYLIDHHEENKVSRSLGRRALIRKYVATAEVLYLKFFKKNPECLDATIASYLYYAIVSDSKTFSYISKHTLQISQDLLKYGINHRKFVERRIKEEEFRFTGWAIAHTQIFPFIQTMILPVYESQLDVMRSMFGDNWYEKELDERYKHYFLSWVNGYNYGFVITSEDSVTEIRWRTRDMKVMLNIAEMLSGIKGMSRIGGHFNAGGCKFEGSVAEALEQILKKMEISLQDPELGNARESDWINYGESSNYIPRARR